jgi:hypothetical protein
MNRTRTAIAILTLALAAPLATACSPEEAPTDAETWAFCGVSPYEPHADAITKSLSQDSNIDATFGPCLPPDWSVYNTMFPGVRYQSATDYMATVKLNAKYDMQTIVYDARVWSTDPAVRAEAIKFWSPVIGSIRAWDMGDEVDPRTPDWAILIERWNIVRQYVTPATGVGPFTNHMPWVLDQALADLPGSAAHMSYDDYIVENSLNLASQWNFKVNHLMCSVNALDHGDFHPSAKQLQADMQAHLDAGCDSFLIFGGYRPYPGKDQAIDFKVDSLVTSTGKTTPLAEAVARGAQNA